MDSATSATGTTPQDITPDVQPITDPAHDRDLNGMDILNAPDIKTERVYVPEWGGAVYLRTLTGEQRDAFERSLLMDDMETRDTTNVRAKLLVRALCDKSGTPLFTDAQVQALGQKSAAGLTRCYNKASEMNRVSVSDVEELAKN